MAQIVTLLSIPVLAWIYTPEDMGYLNLFLALLALLTIFATGGYAGAVMLPRDLPDAVRISALSLWIAALVGSLTAVGVWGFLHFAEMATRADFAWLYWLPAAVLFAGANEVLASLANRLGQYRLISTTNLTRTCVQVAGQAGVGLISPTTAALVGATTVGSATANSRLVRQFRVQARGVTLGRKDLATVAKRYRAFPGSVMPAAIFAASGTLVLSGLIGSTYGVAVLGVWTLALRLLAVPTGLLGTSIGRVYYSRATQVRVAHGDSRGLYLRTLKRMAQVSILPFGLLAVCAPWIFRTFFGPEWADAGMYAQIMAPWIWLRFLSSPLASTALAFERNRVVLVSQVIQFSLTVAIALFATAYELSFTNMLLLISGVLSLNYGSLLLTYFLLIPETPERLS